MSNAKWLRLCLMLIVGLFSLSVVLAEQTMPRDLTELVKLVSPGDDPDDAFGAAIAVDGNIAVIGKPNTGNLDQGAAIVFELINGEWQFSASLFADNTKFMGNSVAIDGRRVIVGAPGSANFEGTAYIFEKDDDGIWRLKDTLEPGSDGESLDTFGVSVAVSGDFALVGAPNDDGVGNSNPGEGAVYVFQRISSTNWQKIHVLRANFGADNDNFGGRVVLEGTTALIGARGVETFTGAVYHFAPDGGAWVQQQIIMANDGSALDFFGDAIALDGDTAVIGAPNTNSSAGAVYVFKRSGGGSWQSQTKLTNPDNAGSDSFGAAVSLRNGLLVVGNALDGDLGVNSGSASVFRANGNQWIFEGEINGSDTVTGDQFGINVEVSDDSVFVGATQHNDARGAVYVFVEEVVITPTPSPTLPGATNTPGGPTETPESTVDPSTNMLVNGGFEADTNTDKIPDSWEQKNPTNDKQKCNKPDKTIAFEGNCAYQFKSAVGENSKLVQAVDLTVNPVQANDVITLSGVVSAKGTVNTNVAIKVKYTDESLSKVKITVSLNAPTAGYQQFSAINPNLTLTLLDQVDSIKAQIKNQGTDGKVFYDAVVLEKTTSFQPPASLSNSLQ